MVMDFTSYLWLNWILVGFFFGIGWQLATAIYNVVLWAVGQRRPAG